jgi:hypothetical protein
LSKGQERFKLFKKYHSKAESKHVLPTFKV